MLGLWIIPVGMVAACYAVWAIVESVVEKWSLQLAAVGKANAQSLHSELSEMKRAIASLHSELAEMERRLPQARRYYSDEPGLDYDSD